LEQIKLDDFTNFRFISGLEFSNDGLHACFAVHKANLDQNDYDSNLWVYQVESGKYYQLTGLNKERAFTWLNDNEHIAFNGLRDPKDKERRENGEEFTVFYRIRIHGGEAVKFFEVPLVVNLIRQIDNENFLLLAAYNPIRPALADLEEAERAKILKQRKDDQDYEVLEAIPFWSNGKGFISGSRNRLYLYNTTSSTLKPLTDESLDISSVALNQTRTQAVMIAHEYSRQTGSGESIVPAGIGKRRFQPAGKPGAFPLPLRRLSRRQADHLHWYRRRTLRPKPKPSLLSS